MKLTHLATCLLALLAAASAPAANEMPPVATPQKEHEWLKQLTGEWECTAELTMEPGKPAVQTTATEVTRPVGGFWTVGETKGDMMGKPFTGIMTLGYSPEKSKYIGTWVDSMQNLLWQYEGTVDPAGQTLILNAEGPCPMQGGKIVKFQETIELKNPDHKIFTSKVEMDGKWQTMMTANLKRKK